jgi:SAM-dependent methyltransferase
MPCACCGGPVRHAFEITDVNQKLGDDVFEYTECLVCGTYQLANPPADLGEYYPSSYYDDLGAGIEGNDAEIAKSQLSLVARFMRARQISGARGDRIIEVGPAVGAFLFQASQAGMLDRVAVERDPRCCQMLRERGVEVHETDDPIEGLADLAPAATVVMFHLIEHVPDPMGLIDAAAAKVTPGGLLLVSTPNPRALSFRICGASWTHVDAPRHLFLLPFEVVRDRAQAAGLAPVHVTTTDAAGLLCDAQAWTPWSLEVARGREPAAYWLRTAVSKAARPIERRGMRGSTYTAIFRRPPEF